MDLSKTCIFSLAEDSQVQAVLTSASICNASLSEVAMTLVRGEDAIAAVHQNGTIFDHLPTEPFIAMGMQIVLYRPTDIGKDLVEPGIYTVVGLLPLSELPVPAEAEEFTDFWAFVCQSIGQTISWSGLGSQLTISVIGSEGDPIRSFTLSRRTVGSRA